MDGSERTERPFGIYPWPAAFSWLNLVECRHEMKTRRPETSPLAVSQSHGLVFHQWMTDEPAMPAARRRSAVVQYNGVSYKRNLSLCRRALTERQVQGEYLGGMIDVAKAAGCSRSTVTRLFNGHSLSMEVTRNILSVLKLSFEEVHTPEVESER